MDIAIVQYIPLMGIHGVLLPWYCTYTYNAHVLYIAWMVYRYDGILRYRWHAIPWISDIQDTEVMDTTIPIPPGMVSW